MLLWWWWLHGHGVLISIGTHQVDVVAVVLAVGWLVRAVGAPRGRSAVGGDAVEVIFREERSWFQSLNLNLNQT